MRSTERDGVLARALAILTAFSTAQPRLTLTELTARTGLPKSTVHRLAAGLVRERLLEQQPDATYRLGFRLFEIGHLVPASRTLSEAALPIMEDLREATRQRIHLAVLDDIDVVYVEILGAGTVHVGSRVGGRLPAHTTGVGKVMLAYSPAALVQARIEAGLPRLTAHTIATAKELREELRTIRTQGFAMDHEESTPGVSCVAAPVFGADKKITAGLSVTGHSRSIEPRQIGPAVRTAAFTLSRALRDAGI